jgi:hypothetical protein
LRIDTRRPEAYHRTIAADYKRRFGYDQRRALMCAALQRRYAERAVGRALAVTIRRRPILDDPELRLRGAARPITLEERLNRSESRRRFIAGSSSPTPKIG